MAWGINGSVRLTFLEGAPCDASKVVAAVLLSPSHARQLRDILTAVLDGVLPIGEPQGHA